MQAQMLAPAAVLVLWSLIMLYWMAFTRLPAIKKVGSGLGEAKPGGRGQDLEGVIPDKVNWKAHNYAHLMEQPTIFYAAVVILAIMGAGAIDVLLAWAYVAIRIVHSLYQATVNIVKLRFLLFLVSTLALTVLAVRAVMATVLFDPSLAPA
ncbi:MAPEG family protein [Qipengyuania sp. 1NDW9]|uniref:MAPEG family protein n=2 Tax=Qipengyuania TaxID=1855416 RepID=A0A9Q3XD15_9SPHN|nr:MULTISPECIES: MAPEG family protein [Qipengyuania]MBX7493518.1 MAPEG family protein [Qipengyuania xiapuensis]MBY6129144.1 MAPEG family protein [Qipengyuania aquimaris]MBY6217316.1 MAPEG family protein [Qipengyuania aquimaris]QZD92360.1 MAPEG family protein [Qipengyuania xiapuensis]UOR14452.1 MAPEG family protein [Qipengyuania aquimaris]